MICKTIFRKPTKRAVQNLSRSLQNRSRNSDTVIEMMGLEGGNPPQHGEPVVPPLEKGAVHSTPIPSGEGGEKEKPRSEFKLIRKWYVGKPYSPLWIEKLSSKTASFVYKNRKPTSIRNGDPGLGISMRFIIQTFSCKYRVYHEN